MKFRKIDATERFNEIAIGVGQEATRTSYRCPTCSKYTSFTEKSFSKALFKDTTVLSNIELTEIERVQPLVRGNWEEFLDFRCVGCGNPVRLIFIPNEFRMGSPFFTLQQVVESNVSNNT